MASADFSQFVVTTANETACETSPVKAQYLSPHLSAAFTGTSGNFWTSSSFADLSAFPSLLCGSCPSDQGFAYSFFQIPSRGGHPCCSAMCFLVAQAHSGLSPVRLLPMLGKQNRKVRCLCGFPAFCLLFELGVFFVVLNCICLIFMQIHAHFYINYIIYNSLLIFCCQNVATNYIANPHNLTTHF